MAQCRGSSYLALSVSRRNEATTYWYVGLDEYEKKSKIDSGAPRCTVMRCDARTKVNSLSDAS